jgi:uncharacterized protein YxeA
MKRIVSIIALAFVLIVAFMGFRYYQNTYQSVDAYAVVPKQVPAKVQTKDASEKVVTGSHSYNYTFHFVTASGKKQTMEYELSGPKVKPFKPGATVKAEISKSRITKGPNYINQEKIPAKAWNQLK